MYRTKVSSDSSSFYFDPISLPSPIKCELVQLDQQLQVSLAEYKSVREKNLELSELANEVQDED